EPQNVEVIELTASAGSKKISFPEERGLEQTKSWKFKSSSNEPIYLRCDLGLESPLMLLTAKPKGLRSRKCTSTRRGLTVQEPLQAILPFWSSSNRSLSTNTSAPFACPRSRCRSLTNTSELSVSLMLLIHQ
ncbi:unnamed protein product, partial [Nesidiocoris tenuis]